MALQDDQVPGSDRTSGNKETTERITDCVSSVKYINNLLTHQVPLRGPLRWTRKRGTYPRGRLEVSTDKNGVGVVIE